MVINFEVVLQRLHSFEHIAASMLQSHKATDMHETIQPAD